MQKLASVGDSPRTDIDGFRWAESSEKKVGRGWSRVCHQPLCHSTRSERFTDRIGDQSPVGTHLGIRRLLDCLSDYASYRTLPDPIHGLLAESGLSLPGLVHASQAGQNGNAFAHPFSRGVRRRLLLLLLLMGRQELRADVDDVFCSARRLKQAAWSLRHAR